MYCQRLTYRSTYFASPVAWNRSDAVATLFSLYPKVLFGVTPFLVRTKTINKASMFSVVRKIPRSIKQLTSSLQHPRCRPVAMNVTQILRPFVLMPWLEAPWAVNVSRVILIVVPIHLKIRG